MSKQEIFEAIKKGFAREVTPELRKKMDIIRLIAEKQPCTLKEIAEATGNINPKPSGLKARLTKLIKGGWIKSVEYQGVEYYLLKTKYDELKQSASLPTKTS